MCSPDPEQPMRLPRPPPLAGTQPLRGILPRAEPSDSPDGAPRAVQTSPAYGPPVSVVATTSPPLRPRVHPALASAYSIGNMLGSGAFGTVWLAQNRATGARAAIKIVDRQRELNEDFRLEPAEAEILKKVCHPNIVKLLDLFTTEQYVYLVMELVTGGHLQNRLHEHGRYDEVQGKLVVVQVVEAMQHLHDISIIHRDIKPENILFAEADDDITVKLTDFGLSTMKEGRLTTRCGTPSYCAPELLSGQGYNKAVDMWSLGVLTYVLLCGVMPFTGADRTELFKKICKGVYEFPKPFDQISNLAKDLISRLLRVAPMERYSTRETLQHPWLTGTAHPTGGPSQGGKDSSDQAAGALDTVHEMMRRFNAERRFRRAFLVVVACLRFRRAGRGGWRDDFAVSGWATDREHTEFTPLP